MVTTGKGRITNDEGEGLAISTKVVWSLMDKLLGRGHCVTVDNFYNFPVLAYILIDQQTNIYGTENNCQLESKQKNLRRKMKKGGFQKGKITIMAWKDKKLVFILSTIHTMKMKEVEKKRWGKHMRPIQ